jgi:hypothetical protein
MSSVFGDCAGAHRDIERRVRKLRAGDFIGKDAAET